MGLTPAGVDEAERLLDEGASVADSLLILSPVEHAAVEVFLDAYRKSEQSDELTFLDAEALAEATASVETIEAQHKSSRPKRRIIRLAISDLHGVLVGAAGSGAFAGLVRLVEALS